MAEKQTDSGLTESESAKSVFETSENNGIQERLSSWDFGSDRGMFDVLTEHPDTILFVTTVEGIASMQLCASMGINQEKLALLVRTVESRYMNVPYHNNVHGADVVHATFWIVTQGGLGEMLAPLHKLALLISACAHDMDHPGTSNTFEKVTKSETALRYNDVSVLENMSITGLLLLLQDDSMNITESMELAEGQRFRQLVTSIILATDLANHKPNVTAFKTYLDSPSGIDMQDPRQCELALGLTVHLADVANTARKWACYKEWIPLLFEEFHQLGDKERELGLPVTTDRATSIPYKAQKGFINMFALNLFETYTRFLPGMAPVKEQLEANLVFLTSEVAAM
jgi:hypothetical protein